MVEVPLWQSRFVVPGAAVELFLAELEDVALSVAAFEEPADAGDGALWRIELMHRGEPDKEQLAACLAPLAERAGLERIDLTVAPLATTNWLARVAASFTPQRIGRFWVHGSHVREAPPAGAVPIRLDAGLAFGSGEHASTRAACWRWTSWRAAAASAACWTWDAARASWRSPPPSAGRRGCLRSTTTRRPSSWRRRTPARMASPGASACVAARATAALRCARLAPTI